MTATSILTEQACLPRLYSANVREIVARVAPVVAHVLILGETGTGKSLVDE
jgi:transcriptional regulator with AAA-type ATPase domain